MSKNQPTLGLEELKKAYVKAIHVLLEVQLMHIDVKIHPDYHNEIVEHLIEITPEEGIPALREKMARTKVRCGSCDEIMDMLDLEAHVVEKHFD